MSEKIGAKIIDPLIYHKFQVQISARFLEKKTFLKKSKFLKNAGRIKSMFI